jgi:electron transfer flavoprotein beta subunit
VTVATRICACVKIVPRAAVPMRMDGATLRLDRSGATELNPHDLFTVEAAVQLRERVGGELVIVTMAPEKDLESLRSALAMGVDRAVAIADPALAGSDLLGTSRVLAAALERERPDVVVFGSVSADGGGAQLGAAVGERMGLPVMSGVRSVEIVGDRIRGNRQSAHAEVVLDAPLPCVVGLGGSANVPRYPTFRDIVAAKKKPIDRVSLADLGIDPASVGSAGTRTAVATVGAPPPRRAAGEIVRDEGDGAVWLFDWIHSRGLA